MSTTLTKSEPKTTSSWLRHPRVLGDLEEFFTEFPMNGPEGWFTGRLVPSLDVTETDNAVEVRMDLPGVKPEEIDIRISGNVMTISGERQEEKEKKEGSVHRIERRMGSFSRSVTLPCGIEEEKVDAKYESGVLKVMLPKCEKSNARKITVKG